MDWSNRANFLAAKNAKERKEDQNRTLIGLIGLIYADKKTPIPQIEKQKKFFILFFNLWNR